MSFAACRLGCRRLAARQLQSTAPVAGLPIKASAAAKTLPGGLSVSAALMPGQLPKPIAASAEHGINTLEVSR